MALTPNWTEDRGLLTLLERFTGTERWDDPATLRAAYERHNAEVRQSVPRDRLLEWRASPLPLGEGSGVRVSRRSEWG